MDAIDISAVAPNLEEETSICVGPDMEEQETTPVCEGNCLVCLRHVNGLEMRSCVTRIRDGDEGTLARNIFCIDCYNKGAFETRCCVCGMYQSCAPMLVGDPKFMCISCQWSENGRRIAEERANAKAARTTA